MARRTTVGERNMTQMLMTKAAKTETTGSVTLPQGLSSGINLRTSLVTPTGVFRVLLQGRMFLFLETSNPPSFMALDKLYTDKLVFIVSGQLNVSSNMYNPRLPKYPAEVQTRLVSFGTSSLVLESILRVPGFPQVTASLRNNLVVVSKSNRKTSPLPDWFREKFGPFYNKDAGVIVKQLETTPTKTCRGVNSLPYMLTVISRDIDMNQHVNTVLYLQYCIDALDDHLIRNKIQCNLNTESLLLKSASFLHRGESKVTDILAVEFWDDETESEMICFNILKSGSSIYQARIHFYRYEEIFPQTSKL